MPERAGVAAAAIIFCLGGLALSLSAGGGGALMKVLTKPGTLSHTKPASIPYVDGAAADEMKHALPRATARRVSLTFRRLSSSVRGSLDASHGAVLASREALHRWPG